MLDLEAILDSNVHYYKKEMKRPNSINSFNGTFQIGDHARIHEVFNEFLMYSFKTSRLRKIKIEDINKLLNEVWEGPGSVEKILRMTHELRQTGISIGPVDLPKKKAVQHQIDDDGPVASYGDQGPESADETDQ